MARIETTGKLSLFKGNDLGWKSSAFWAPLLLLAVLFFVPGRSADAASTCPEWTEPAPGALEVCVSNATMLQDCLQYDVTGEESGAYIDNTDNTIKVEQGTYVGNFLYQAAVP